MMIFIKAIQMNIFLRLTNQKLRDLGFTTFDNTENLTDLYVDIYNNIFISPANLPNNKFELYDLDGFTNFGANIADRYIPIAVEVITDPELHLPENVGEYLVLLLTKKGQLTAFVFDKNGVYYQNIGFPTTNKGINDAENIFGFDLNRNGFQGSLNEEEILTNNTFKVGELQELKHLDFTTFNNTENLTDLYVDIYNNSLFPSKFT